MVKDKRNYIRKKAKIEILYPTLIYGEDKKLIIKPDSLYTIDISETGMAFVSRFYIPKSSFLSFYLRLGDEIPFQVLTNIIWNKIENGKFLCGGEFVGLSMDNINTIRNFMK
ncbi:MAG TPA: hypothetical protein DEF85_00755 [Clostridiaceae bacterium]|jgi:hypothetical protein|nr:hypothetical protein [Clostridiaceae bacterium]HBF78345.1 hypothetical protein [Clostridiaceae bacterium]HBN28029.1 hypothetical protein [Clostridiaceae bacterium]HBX47418.1 hypothetical protein [Clostridiaceae bacterium]HCL49913.1 hypothetical protein [Clostridiaceae bacterium]